MGRGGWSWKRALGITKAKRKISKATGIPLTKSGRQGKAGKMVTSGCLIPATVSLLFALFILFGV